MNSKEEGKVEQNSRIKQSRIPNMELFVKSNRDFILLGPDNSFLYHLISLSYKSGLRKIKSMEETCLLEDFQEKVRVQMDWNNMPTLKTCIHLNSFPL